MFQLIKKLNSCRDGLKTWSREHFGNNKIQIVNLKSELALLQAQPFSAQNFLLQNQLKSDLEYALNREEMFLHQRSCVRWLNFGDKNSRFFHASLIQRRQRNQLLRLQTEDGVWLNSDSEIDCH
ncbi:hypothetical protein ACSBR2_041050 [Camellia fascicularis]